MIPHLGQWAVWAATEAEAVETIVPVWVKVVITIGVFLIPYGLGVLIARAIKLKEYAIKISVVLFAATLGVMPFAYQGILYEYERQHYERQIKAWTAREDASQLDKEALERTLQEQNPALRVIETPEEAAEAQISSIGN